jgi:acyl carrier protein
MTPAISPARYCAWTAAWQCKKIDKKTLKTQRAVGILPPTVPTRKNGLKMVPFSNKGERQVSENMDIKAVEAKVIEIVSEQMGVDKSEISRETSFINDLNADSLDTVELVMEFEDEFDMSIPDEEAEKIQTVGAAIDYIMEVIKKKGSE